MISVWEVNCSGEGVDASLGNFIADWQAKNDFNSNGMMDSCLAIFAKPKALVC